MTECITEENDNIRHSETDGAQKRAENTALAEKGGDMGLKIRIQSEEIFEAMHRI